MESKPTITKKNKQKTTPYLLLFFSGFLTACVLFVFFLPDKQENVLAQQTQQKVQQFVPQTFVDEEQNNIEVFQSAKDSVVYVTTKRLVRDFFSFNVFEKQAGSGTGFVWNKDGIIVTNYHVIENSNSILVSFSDPQTYSAKVVGLAPEKDLAILKVDAPKEKFVPLRLGNSASMKVGNKVLAIGNPFGLDQTLTTGIVSALGRQIISPSNNTIEGVIQTDAAINPGNSGGPLLNSAGEIVGVNTAIVSSSGSSAGIGFAIPINEVKSIIPQLIAYGKIRRLSLGLSYLEDKIAKFYGLQGVVVLKVKPGSSAAKAGLQGIKKLSNGEVQLGDQIIKINDQEIRNSDDIYQALEKKAPQDKVTLTTVRSNKTLRYTITLDYIKGW